MKRLAEKYHAGQFRKGEGNIPYIVHPQAVAETLQKWGENPDSRLFKAGVHLLRRPAGAALRPEADEPAGGDDREACEQDHHGGL